MEFSTIASRNKLQRIIYFFKSGNKNNYTLIRSVYISNDHLKLIVWK